ncbi:family 43 glycosylhydrolase [Luedemannella helvata]|uniref:CBM2 domain-containing protein n=1 Tax=Luedemannella helvata TaxID=349315 RepID=A0ABN2KHP1_9ACTN
MLRTPQRVALLAGGLAATVVAGTGVVVAVSAQAAAAGCAVSYRVTNQWPNGFGADVNVNNLGDPINGWTLTWTFGAGQTIQQAWSAAVTQAGADVTAKNVSYNGSIPTGGSTSFGFNGSWSGSNPVPTNFALNGVTCTGAVATSGAAPTTAPRTTQAPQTTRAPLTSAVVTSRAPVTTGPATPTIPPASYPNPGVVNGDTGVHDPTVVKTPAGTYIAAHTGTNIQLKTSTDRTTWRNAGAAFPGGASWTTTYTGGSANLWAPDISYHNGQYYMYYSASTFGSNRSAIFLATSPTGASGSWTHRGLVIETTSSSNYNAIDPNLVVDDAGNWWLSFGSFWSGLKLIALNPGTGLRSDTTVRAIAARGGGTTAIEAPFIFKHGGYYYLWVSWDTCCQGANSTYRIMVGRSTSVTGPYTDRNGVAMTAGGGTQVLATHGGVIGPGHQAVIRDNDGDVLVYHYYTSSGASYLGINRIGYDGAGWPFVY